MRRCVCECECVDAVRLSRSRRELNLTHDELDQKTSQKHLTSSHELKIGGPRVFGTSFNPTEFNQGETRKIQLI